MIRAVAYGGPWDRVKLELKADEPPGRIVINDHLYEAVNDPDTGDFLGCYVYATKEKMRAYE